jgi:hypothetical protein
LVILLAGYFGRVDTLAKVRKQALDGTYTAHPERFVRGRPKLHLPSGLPKGIFNWKKLCLKLIDTFRRLC